MQRYLIATMNPWDYGTACACLGILTLYHIQYYFSIIARKTSSNHILLTNVKIALSWIKKHKAKGDALNVTSAIHTLQNTIVIAIFVGGNSLSFGLNYSLNYKDIVGDEVLQLQYIIMCVCLLCSFLCWACVIRYASHVGYYIGSLSHEEEEKNNTLNTTNDESKSKKVTSFTLSQDAIVYLDDVDLESQTQHDTIKKSTITLHYDPMMQCANMIALTLIFFK